MLVKHRVLLAGFALAVGTAKPSIGAQRPSARLTSSGPATPPSVTPARLEAPTAAEWLTYGRTYDNQRYSPLTQISRATIDRLAPRAIVQLTLPRPGGLETSPLVADGIMYVTGSYDVVAAFDLRTHEQLWRYEHKIGAANFCCGPNNRGAALGHGLVYIATLDARLVALDAGTGAVRWDTQVGPADSAFSMSMAPVVAGDLVVIGSAGGEFATRGRLSAYDARTGELRWRFFTIPSPADGGWWGNWSATTPTGESLGRDLAREHADSARYTDSWQIGGGPVWTPPAYDPERGLLIFGVGNPAPSNDGEPRPGDNLYTSSIVAIDARTGKIRWYFQPFPHDVWDYDVANPVVLVRIGERLLAVQAGKSGWGYVLDAATGALVRRTEAFVPQRNMFVAPDSAGVVISPAAMGGANWPPSAYSPRTGYIYVPAVHMPHLMHRAPTPPEKGKFWTGGSYSPTGEEAGYLSAIDVASGRIKWQVKTEQPLLSGALATAGGLVFVGESNGWFRAYDERTGAKLWEFPCGAGVNAPPVSFELDGEQYVAVAAGGSNHSKTRGSAVIIFGLGRSGAAALRGQRASAGDGVARSRSETEARPPAARGTVVNEFLSYDRPGHVASLGVTAALGGANHGMSFNGGFNGRPTITVPLGWTVRIHFANLDAVPHSLLVFQDANPIPAITDAAAFPRALTTHVSDGLSRGASDDLEFVADRAGSYLLICGVPGHGAAGMYVRFVVSSGDTAPNYR